MNYKNAVFTLALLFSSSLQANEPPQATAGEGACLSAQLIYALEGRPTPQCHASTMHWKSTKPSCLNKAKYAYCRESGLRITFISSKKTSTPLPPHEFRQSSFSTTFPPEANS